MKPFVSRQAKVALLVGLVVWVVAQIVHAKEAGYLALLCAALFSYAVFDYSPRWLRHSSVGRWLRR